MSSALLSVAALAEAEPSKVPFYAAGGLLVLFAVVLGALGIVRHDFPASKGVRSAVLAVGALLVLATMAGAVVSG